MVILLKKYVFSQIGFMKNDLKGNLNTKNNMADVIFV